MTGIPRKFATGGIAPGYQPPKPQPVTTTRARTIINSSMRKGHENCNVEMVTETSMNGFTRYHATCQHQHTEPVQADDGMGTGPIVAHYCQCCGAMIREGDYA